MPRKKKNAKPVNPTARTNRIYSLSLVVSGILFVAIPGRIAEVLPFYLSALLLLHAALMTYRWSKISKNKKKRLARVGCLIDAAVSFVLCVLFVVFRERSADLGAIFMAVRTAAVAVEYGVAIGKNRRDPRAIIGCVSMIVINLVLLAKLVTEIGGSLETQIVIYGLLFLVQGVAGIYANLKDVMPGNLFGRVIVKTYAAEILAGLMIAVVGASILLPIFEPAIETFADGLWYSFMLVTTIGFGDMTAVTPAGRLISVAIGIYGIIAVALITSILVSVYNESKDKADAPSRSSSDKDKQ